MSHTMLSSHTLSYNLYRNDLEVDPGNHPHFTDGEAGGTGRFSQYVSRTAQLISPETEIEPRQLNSGGHALNRCIIL